MMAGAYLEKYPIEGDEGANLSCSTGIRHTPPSVTPFDEHRWSSSCDRYGPPLFLASAAVWLSVVSKNERLRAVISETSE